MVIRGRTCDQQVARSTSGCAAGLVAGWVTVCVRLRHLSM